MTTQANVLDVPGNGNLNIRRVTWGALANGNDGAPVGPDLALWSDRSVQVTGTFGVGGTLTVYGSNDGVNWAPLTSPNGVACAFTAAGLKQVLESTLYLKPMVTAGDGTTALTVTLFLRLPTQRVG